jgi:hypothetical protein
MKLSLTLIFFLIASISFAQPPRIDSLRIDESKGLLSVYGEFGSVQGKVWCDSVELGVAGWSDTIVIAAIPDTGKGSAGPVVVGARGYQSGERKITFWSGTWSYNYNNSPNNYEWDWQDESVKYVLRLDIESFISAKNTLNNCSLSRGSTYSLHGATGWQGTHGDGEERVIQTYPQTDFIKLQLVDSNYGMGFHAVCKVDLQKKIITLTLSKIRGYEIRHSVYESGQQKTTDFQSYPINDFTFQLPLNANYSIKALVEYDDPSFQKKTRIAPLSYLFEPLIEPNNVSYSTSAVILSTYPNPAKDIVHISYSLDKPTALHLAAYDLRGNLVKLLQSDFSTNSGIVNWDASSMPSGDYVIGLSNGSQSYSTIVSIVR